MSDAKYLRTALKGLIAAAWGSGFALVLAISVPLNGFLISAEWGWFIAPITGVRQISVTEGVGLSLFCTTIGIIATAHLKKWDFGDDAATYGFAGALMIAMVMVGIIGPLCGLATAWAWHSFFM